MRDNSDEDGEGEDEDKEGRETGANILGDSVNNIQACGTLV